jgi:hypothetical protein
VRAPVAPQKSQEDGNHEELHLIKSPMSSFSSTCTSSSGVILRIDQVGLSANNMSYLAFGQPLSIFFNTYPLEEAATLVDDETGTALKNSSKCMIHPPTWGLTTVVESSVPKVPLRSRYPAMVPIATQVHFDDIQVGFKFLATLMLYGPRYMRPTITLQKSTARPAWFPRQRMMTMPPIRPVSLWYAFQVYYYGVSLACITSSSDKTYIVNH